MNIHNTAIVSDKAQIGENVSIGPFTIIEDDVIIGKNTEIHANVLIKNGSHIGENCKIFHAAVIAELPQDIKFDPSVQTKAIIGKNTTIREFVTIHRGTEATAKTTIGDNCLIMAYSHIAHDCHLGNNIIMANATQLAGHVTAEDWVIFGGGTLVHQFTAIGCHSMIQGGSKITQDVPPYSLAGREPVKIEGLNKIGLRRRGFTNEQIDEIEKFYKYIYHKGFNISAGIKKYLEENPNPNEYVQHYIDFIKKSKRGIIF